MITFTCKITQVDNGNMSIVFEAPPAPDVTATERHYYEKMLDALKEVIMSSSKNVTQVEIDPSNPLNRR